MQQCVTLFCCGSFTVFLHTLQELKTVNRSMADKLTDTGIVTNHKCIVRDCRQIIVVEDKNFTDVLKATLDMFFKPMSRCTVLSKIHQLHGATL